MFTTEKQTTSNKQKGKEKSEVFTTNYNILDTFLVRVCRSVIVAMSGELGPRHLEARLRGTQSSALYQLQKWNVSEAWRTYLYVSQSITHLLNEPEKFT